MIVPTVAFVPGPWTAPGPAPAPPPPAVSDFWTALRAWFAADPDLPGWFPGGVKQGPAAAGQAMPFLLVVEREPQDPASAEDWRMEAGFAVLAADSDSAKSLAEAFLAKLDGTAARPRLAWGEWVEAGHRTVKPSAPYKVGYVRDGTPAWRFDFTVLFDVLLTTPGASERP